MTLILIYQIDDGSVASVGHLLAVDELNRCKRIDLRVNIMKQGVKIKKKEQ